MATPEVSPALAVKTRRTQLTRVPVMSCLTLKGGDQAAQILGGHHQGHAHGGEGHPLGRGALHGTFLLSISRSGGAGLTPPGNITVPDHAFLGGAGGICQAW